jgi:hypothetical protein
MTTKSATTKPATPLPWKDGPLFNRDAKAVFWSDTSKPGKWQRRVDTDKDGAFGQLDAAYIVHACNAYPELVAFVRHAANLSEGSYQAAAALLVKLGEAA